MAYKAQPTEKITELRKEMDRLLGLFMDGHDDYLPKILSIARELRLRGVL